MTTTEKPKTGEQPEPTAEKPTASEVMGTLTGFDELAIEKAFGDDITKIAMTSYGKFGRALAFTLFRRDGASDADAKKRVLEMRRSEIDDLFADEDDELPGSEAGKGES